MKTSIRERRIQSGLTLREMSKALGWGFSPAKLSLAERGLVQIPEHEENAILEAIERLAPLCANRRRIVEIAREIDFAPLLTDLRQATLSQVHP